MPRVPLLLAVLAAGCAVPDDGVPPSPRGSLPPDAERDFIEPASGERQPVPGGTEAVKGRR